MKKNLVGVYIYSGFIISNTIWNNNGKPARPFLTKDECMVSG